MSFFDLLPLIIPLASTKFTCHFLGIFTKDDEIDRSPCIASYENRNRNRNTLLNQLRAIAGL
jgi:hypothetical protein